MPSRMPRPAKTETAANSFWDRKRYSSITTVRSAGGPAPKRRQGGTKDEAENADGAENRARPSAPM